MPTKTQPSIEELEFVVGSMAKRGMYKTAALPVLFLIVILMVIGFSLLI